MGAKAVIGHVKIINTFPTEIICAVTNDHVVTLKINTVHHIAFFRTVEKYLQVTLEFRLVSHVRKLFS